MRITRDECGGRWQGIPAKSSSPRQARISPSSWDVACGASSRRVAPASFVPNAPSGAIEIGLLLLPGFDLHDLSVLADCFALSNALGGAPRFMCRTVAVSPAPVFSSLNTVIHADTTLEVLHSKTNLVILAGTDLSSSEGPRLYHWIAQRARSAIGLAAVSGGCRVLAAARVLNMKTAAIHWELSLGLRETYPDVKFLERMFVTDGRIMTCSGRSATIDFALYCIAGSCGGEMARAVADHLNHDQFREHNRKQVRWTDASTGKTPRSLRRATALMNEHLEHPLSTSEVARHVGTSSRHLQRIFLQYFRLTPGRFYQNHRLQCARHLVRQTSMTVTEIALVTGFKTTSHFSERYWRLFGVRPSQDRVSGGIIGESRTQNH